VDDEDCFLGSVTSTSLSGLIATIDSSSGHMSLAGVMPQFLCW
jgi:hypothetical protein